MDRLIQFALLVALTLAVPKPAWAQGSISGHSRPVSLQAAIDAALTRNSDLAIAEARRDVARSQTRNATGSLLPRIDVQAGYIRSVDPVVAFGTKLRQGRFSEPDLAFDVLNDPDPVGDWSTVVGVQWSLLDPTRWAGRSAARRQAEAADWSTERTREATILMTRTHYLQAQAAAAQLEAADAALEASQAMLDQFRRRRDRGLLTEADLLGAVAELSAARADRAEADRARLDAFQLLGRHLGWSPDTVPEPVDSLAAPADMAAVEFEPAARADLRARAAAARAAGAAKRQAALAFVPALDAFAQYATHSTDAFSFDEADWTVGVMLRWNLFNGFARSADLQRANLERRIADLEYEQALRDALSERDQVERSVGSARQQVEATGAGATAAESGRQLMRRRFEEGLATAADLLQAEARATAMRQRAINALANYHIAVARLDFVQSQINAEK